MPMPRLTYIAYLALAAFLSGPSLAAEPQIPETTIEDHKIFLSHKNDPSAPALVILHGFESGSVEHRILAAQLHEKFDLTLPSPLSATPALTPPKSGVGRLPDGLVAAINMLVAGTEYPDVSLLVEGYAAPIGIRLASRDEQEAARAASSSIVEFQH